MPRRILPTASLSIWGRVRELLGLGGPVSSETDLALIVGAGLDVATLDRLAAVGFERRELFELVIPQRTLTHRKNRGEPLSAEESDRAVRLARVSALAERVFANHDKAWRWLRRPTPIFDARAPMELLATETGARAVEEELYRIDEGMFA